LIPGQKWGTSLFWVTQHHQGYSFVMNSSRFRIARAAAAQAPEPARGSD
jgi:hypothetical protein